MFRLKCGGFFVTSWFLVFETIFIYIFFLGGGGWGCWYIDLLTCIEVYLWIDQTKISHIFISVINLNLSRDSVLFYFVTVS